MARILRAALVAAISLSAAVFAQVSTDCNPMNTTCPPDPALGQYAEFDFRSSEANAKIWKYSQSNIVFNNDGAGFPVRASGDGPNLGTEFYIFFGSLSVVMRAAPGDGICSSIVLLSDLLDEVDWEVRQIAEQMVSL